MPAGRKGALGDVVDEELIRRAVAGEQDCFRVLVSRHRGLIEAACVAALGPRADREDAVQVALVDIWRGLSGFEGTSSFTTWVYRVARNAAVRNATRRKGRDEIPTERILDHVSRGDEWEEVSSTREVILAVLDRLPDDQREALLLHTQAGVPLKEIASTLYAAEGTVKAWIHRARAEIAGALAASTEVI